MWMGYILKSKDIYYQTAVFKKQDLTLCYIKETHF